MNALPSKHSLWLICLLAVAGAAGAATVPNLYQAAVPVADQSVDARHDATSRALAKVLVRITGDTSAPNRAGSVLARAGQLVQEYGYESSQADGLKLRARFDARAVDRAVRGAGLPIWGAERPTTLVWVADDGGLISAGDSDSATTAMRQAASDRGVPLTFPSSGDVNSGRVSVADVRNNNDARLAAAARSYGTDHLLVGRATPAGGGWRGYWRLVRNGVQQTAWSDRAASAAALFDAAVRHMADYYGQRFAVRADSGGGGAVAVAVDGVTDAADYTRVSHYLAGLTAVDAVLPVAVSGDHVVFKVSGPGNAQSLSRSIGLANWLSVDNQARIQASRYAGGASVLGYRLTP